MRRRAATVFRAFPRKRSPLRASLLRAAMVIVPACILAVVAACAGPDMTGPLASRVRAWEGGASFTGSTAALRQESSEITKMEARQDFAGMKSLCVVLGDDARQAEGYLPAPDATMTQLLNSAYEAYYSAGEECYKAVAGRANQSELAAMNTFIGQATSDLSEGVSRASTLAGEHGKS